MQIKYYSVPEAGEKLGVSRQRVHQYIKENRLPYEWVGGTRIISEESIKNLKRGHNYHKQRRK